MGPEIIRNYLSLGFLPDADTAADYLHSLLGRPAREESDPGKLLVEIVEDLSAGASDVAIPLTAGNDSRGLLGAALELFAARRIHCFTFGPEDFEDVRGAREACGAAGVEHHVIDPDRIEWSLPALQLETERRLNSGMGVAPIDGLAVFSGLGAAIPDHLPVLSGFLGDTVSGKHLAGNGADNDHRLVVADFYQRNSALLDARPHALFAEFLRTHERLKADWPGLTSCDLLDLGFRQRLRIRAVTTAAFARVVRPYEDARWIAHWYSRAIEARTDQRSYVDSLQSRFARLFPRQPRRRRLRAWLGRHKRRVACEVLKMPLSEHWIAHRGDPRRNASMAAVLEEACRSFDRRGLVAAGTATTAFEALMRHPSRASFLAARWYASAEILARSTDKR